MKQSNPIFKFFVADQNAMTENGRQYLFDKYGDDKEEWTADDEYEFAICDL